MDAAVSANAMQPVARVRDRGCEVITYDSIEADRIARSLDISNT